MVGCRGPHALLLDFSLTHPGVLIAGTVDAVASASHETVPAESSAMPTSTAAQQASQVQLDLASTHLQGVIATKEPASLLEAIHSLVKVMADAPQHGSQLSEVRALGFCML